MHAYVLARVRSISIIYLLSRLHSCGLDHTSPAPCFNGAPSRQRRRGVCVCVCVCVCVGVCVCEHAYVRAIAVNIPLSLTRGILMQGNALRDPLTDKLHRRPSGRSALETSCCIWNLCICVCVCGCVSVSCAQYCCTPLNIPLGYGKQVKTDVRNPWRSLSSGK